MSLWRTKSAALAIGAHGITLDAKPLAAAAGDWPALAAELAQLLPARARLSVEVADYWVRYFLLDPPAGVHSLRDCRLLLPARFEALYGHSAADWLLRADWQAGAPMLACALPRALAQALEPFRTAHLMPALLAAWNRSAPKLPQSGALCAAADGQLTLLYWDDARLRLVRQQRGQHADGLLALELTRIDAPLPQLRLWSGEAMPSGWGALR